MSPSAPLTNHLVGFAAFLRAHQIPVDPSGLADILRVAQLGCLQDRQHLKAGFRCALCCTQDHWQRFDLLFDAWFCTPATDEPTESGSPPDPDASVGSVRTDSGERLLGFGGTSDKEHPGQDLFGAGDYKALSLADFRFVIDPQQRLRIEALVDSLAQRMLRQRVRGYRRASNGRAIDLRHTLRASQRCVSQPLQLHYRKPRTRLPRFVLLVDISQSMEVYSRLFLRFSCHLLRSFDRSIAFAFNTDLVPLGKGGRRLNEQNFENIMNQAGKGWLGGTRIAHSLAQAHDTLPRQWLARHTTVLVFSDGCDTARPEVLAREVARLHQRSGRLVWVNPLLGRLPTGTPDMRMDPLLPFIDHYESARNLQGLEALQKVLLGRTWGC